ncbi:MAG: hypothetical protein HC913_17315 [Microscillaceae bacterium]|nr:hypothetical protein [Microscillaceae bacterium]
MVKLLNNFSTFFGNYPKIDNFAKIIGLPGLSIMGKRQKRVLSPQLAQELPGLLGQEMTLVLQNGVSYFGILLTLEAGQVGFQDKLRRKHRIALTDIAEVILDQNHPW